MPQPLPRKRLLFALLFHRLTGRNRSGRRCHNAVTAATGKVRFDPKADRMIPLILGTLLFSLLALLSAALGHRLLRLLHGPPLRGAERGVWAMALGMGALSYLPFLLFTLGLGRPIGIRIAVCALLLLLASDLKSVLHGGVRW